jgi:hypothetical protein
MSVKRLPMAKDFGIKPNSFKVHSYFRLILPVIKTSHLGPGLANQISQV